MKMTQLKRLLSVILCIVLIAATALFTTGCGDSSNDEDGDSLNGSLEQPAGSDDGGEITGETDGETSEPDETTAEGAVKELGEGSKSFDFTVVDLDGNETKFLIKTDKTTVGDALLDVKLIEGEESQYGLYVKKVNGITADYDKDKTYWGFYVDGEYAMSGVDTTNIEEGKTYTFKVSK